MRRAGTQESPTRKSDGPAFHARQNTAARTGACAVFLSGQTSPGPWAALGPNNRATRSVLDNGLRFVGVQHLRQFARGFGTAHAGKGARSMRVLQKEAEKPAAGCPPPPPQQSGVDAEFTIPLALLEPLVELARRADKQISIGE